jgi:hypothetical protein
MGSFASKTWNEMCEYYYELSPKKNNETIDKRVGYSLYLGSDPRSPTLLFDRTPIQIVDIKQKQIDLNNSGLSLNDIMFEDMATDSDKWSTHLNKLNKLLDPRSPTVGIDRTPVDLRENESIVVEICAMRLSFGTNESHSSSQSLSSTPIKDDLNSIPQITQNQVSKTNDNGITPKQEKVRTPLASVQQKQTPISGHLRQRKSLNIEKRAHFNTRLLNNKLRTENNENFISTQVSHDKENVQNFI